MKETPIDFKTVEQIIKDSQIPNVGKASIRELVKIVNTIEAETGEKFIRMEMGVPGLNPPEVGTAAEIDALRNGVASKYPMIEGVAPLKTELSKFVKNFLNIDVLEDGCIPTVGSMQGSFATFLVASRRFSDTKTLFIDPGFPVQKQQMNVIGLPFETFDVYNYRGAKLEAKLKEYILEKNVSSIVYSNPNNPSWICFTDEELQIIGKLANEHNLIIIEDLAYFGMDFRKDYSNPGKAPFQPSVANYTDNYILMISSSKAFSYAGQRIGALIISDKVYNQSFPDLKRFFASDKFGHSIIYGALYSLTSGTSHSAQWAFKAILEAANNGSFNFIESVKEYGERAHEMKRLFVENGFNIVYDTDVDKPIADGFYFTISYPGMSGSELIENLLYYGVSAISLDITGSERTEGLRACVSQTSKSQFEVLEQRLKKFNEHFPIA